MASALEDKQTSSRILIRKQVGLDLEIKRRKLKLENWKQMTSRIEADQQLNESTINEVVKEQKRQIGKVFKSLDVILEDSAGVEKKLKKAACMLESNGIGYEDKSVQCDLPDVPCHSLAMEIDELQISISKLEAQLGYDSTMVKKPKAKESRYNDKRDIIVIILD